MLLIVFVTFRTYTKTLRMHFHINRSLCFVFSSESNVDFWWLLLYFMLHGIWKLFIKLASTTQNNDECNFLKWHPGNQWPSWRNSYFHFFYSLCFRDDDLTVEAKHQTRPEEFIILARPFFSLHIDTLCLFLATSWINMCVHVFFLSF